jgi:hypothetical protein
MRSSATTPSVAASFYVGVLIFFFSKPNGIFWNPKYSLQAVQTFSYGDSSPLLIPGFL